jgi:hypothetical protein
MNSDEEYDDGDVLESSTDSLDSLGGDFEHGTGAVRRFRPPPIDVNSNEPSPRSPDELEEQEQSRPPPAPTAHSAELWRQNHNGGAHAGNHNRR